MKVEITVTDNEVIMSTPMGANVYSNHLIITKEAFIECYEKWIKPIEQKDEVRMFTDEELKTYQEVIARKAILMPVNVMNVLDGR